MTTSSKDYLFMFLLGILLFIPSIKVYATTAPAAGGCAYSMLGWDSPVNNVRIDLNTAKSNCYSNDLSWAGVLLSKAEYLSFLTLIATPPGGAMTQAQFDALLSSSVSMNSVIASLNTTITNLNNHISADASTISNLQSQINLNTSNISANTVNINSLSTQLNSSSSVVATPFDSTVGAAFFSFALTFVIGLFLMARNAGTIIDAVKRF